MLNSKYNEERHQFIIKNDTQMKKIIDTKFNKTDDPDEYSTEVFSFYDFDRAFAEDIIALHDATEVGRLIPYKIDKNLIGMAIYEIVDYDDPYVIRKIGGVNSIEDIVNLLDKIDPDKSYDISIYSDICFIMASVLSPINIGRKMSSPYSKLYYDINYKNIQYIEPISYINCENLNNINDTYLKGMAHHVINEYGNNEKVLENNILSYLDCNITDDNSIRLYHYFPICETFLSNPILTDKTHFSIAKHALSLITKCSNKYSIFDLINVRILNAHVDYFFNKFVTGHDDFNESLLTYFIEHKDTIDLAKINKTKVLRVSLATYDQLFVPEKIIDPIIQRLMVHIDNGMVSEISDRIHLLSVYISGIPMEKLKETELEGICLILNDRISKKYRVKIQQCNLSLFCTNLEQMRYFVHEMFKNINNRTFLSKYRLLTDPEGVPRKTKSHTSLFDLLLEEFKDSEDPKAMKAIVKCAL